MSKKTKAPVIVHLRKGKHKTQPWTWNGHPVQVVTT